jgi:hypothetical protein
LSLSVSGRCSGILLGLLIMPEDDSGPVTVRAKRACRNCVKVKAKCVPRNSTAAEGDQKICQRCFRLGKDCSASVSGEPRLISKQEQRLAKLEERLNEVTTTLIDLQRDVKETRPASSTLQDINRYLFGHTAAPLPNPAASGGSIEEAPDNFFCSGLKNNYQSPAVPQDHASVLDEIDHDIQQNIFGEFCAILNTFFPFVVLSSTETIHSLRRERPYLYRACMYAGCRRYPVWQRRLAECILRSTGEAMLVYGHRSLDLLQSLLVFVSWYQFHGHVNPQLMNLLHLCMSLVMDLGLGSSSGRVYSSNPRTIAGDAERIIHGGSLRGVKTNEERRAVLGCYFLMSNYSSIFHRLDYMNFTPHLQQCCDSLAESPDYASDAILSAVLRAQHLVEKSIMSSDQQLSLNLSVRLFTEQLDNFRSSLGPSVLNSEFFDLHLISAQVTVRNTQCWDSLIF